MLEPELILKSTPPRLPRAALERPRFVQTWEEVRECAGIAVIAPAGFGKTTLLLQWRRLWLQSGALVAWLTLDLQDEPSRFTGGVLHSLRAATGRAAFELLATRSAAQPQRELEAMTALLAEVAQLGVETVLVLDDAERLPDASLQLLAYLLHNAPPNLHLLLGSRRALEVPTVELAARGNLAVLRSDDLRLQVGESIEILQRRFGARISLDDCAHLHDVTEGWPIGLQLACAAIERAPDLSAAVHAISGTQANIAQYFLQSLLAQLPPPVSEFLVQVSILERMSEELCEQITRCERAGEYLALLARDTPFLHAAETDVQWLRLHPLARDFLLARFEALPLESREVLHCRAYHWFAKRDRFHEAACHALAAGDLDATQAHAVRSLWTLAIQGKLSEAIGWLERIPAQVLEDDVELHLIASWIMVFGERNDEALRVARSVLDDPSSSPRLRVMASRVAAAAAAYSDRVALIPAIYRDWPDERSEMEDPVYEIAYHNTFAALALHQGDIAGAKARSDYAVREGGVQPPPLVLAFSRLLAAMALAWEGDVPAVEAKLRPLLAEAERDYGRRDMVPCLYAPLLASTLQAHGDHAGAMALLADRLDVIERIGLPDINLIAYLTLAKAAIGQGDERRALSVLESLEAYAGRRDLPRLAMYAVAESVRIHAQRNRRETAEATLDRLDSLAARFDEPDRSIFQPQFQLALAIARSYVALARSQVEAAASQLGHAEALAARLGRARDQLVAKLLRVELARIRGDDDAQVLLQEVLGLVELRGDSSLLDEAPTGVIRMAGGKVEPAPAPESTSADAVATGPVQVVVGGLLTPKEAHILALLSRGMSNKLIARAMEISDETVKWHLKNLFAKLSAGSRDHAVGRARLLGLISS